MVLKSKFSVSFLFQVGCLRMKTLLELIIYIYILLELIIYIYTGLYSGTSRRVVQGLVAVWDLNRLNCCAQGGNKHQCIVQQGALPCHRCPKEVYNVRL